MKKETIISALKQYRIEIQLGGKHRSQSEITKILNKIDIYEDYLNNNSATIDWLKENATVISKAVTSARDSMRRLGEDNCDEYKDLNKLVSFYKAFYNKQTIDSIYMEI